MIHQARALPIAGWEGGLFKVIEKGNQFPRFSLLYYIRIVIESENHDSWYAVRTFNAQEFKVSEYLKKHSLPHFIPIVRSRVKALDGDMKWRVRPVVHNLIFVRKAFSEGVVRKILSECPYPLSVYRR